MDARGGARRALMLYLPLLVALILLATFQSAMAAVQIESGMTQQLGNTPNRGTTSYVIYYTYPSMVPVGSNLTISLSLHVGSFSGVIEFTVGYEIAVQLYVGRQQQQVTLPARRASTLRLFFILAVFGDRSTPPSR